MINFFIIAIAFAYSFSSDAEDGDETTTPSKVLPDSYLARYQFKGPVKEVQETYYNVEITGDGSDTALTIGYGGIKTYTYGRGIDLTQFNEYGNRTHRLWKDIHDSDTLIYNYYLSYNDLQQKVKFVSKYFQQGMQREDIKVFYYTYDENGRLIEETQGEGKDKRKEREYTYDDGGNVQTCFNWSIIYGYPGGPHQYIRAKEIAYIDSVQNKRTEVKYKADYRPDGEIFFVKNDSLIREFNKNGQQIRYSTFGDSTEMNYLATTEYNEYGYVIRDVKESFNNPEFRKTVLDFEYEYDDHKNWIRRTIYEGDIPLHVTSRKIEYY